MAADPNDEGLDFQAIANSVCAEDNKVEEEEDAGSSSVAPKPTRPPMKEMKMKVHHLLFLV